MKIQFVIVLLSSPDNYSATWSKFIFHCINCFQNHFCHTNNRFSCTRLPSMLVIIIIQIKFCESTYLDACKNFDFVVITLHCWQYFIFTRICDSIVIFSRQRNVQERERWKIKKDKKKIGKTNTVYFLEIFMIFI